MGILDILYAGDNAARVGNVLAAAWIAYGQHVILHMWRLADLHGRDARHEGRIIHADKRQVRIIIDKQDRAVV